MGYDVTGDITFEFTDEIATEIALARDTFPEADLTNPRFAGDLI